MKYSFKQPLAAIAAPVLGRLNHLQQYWQKFTAFCQLYHHLPNVDSSIVVLAMPELHGTRQIYLGKKLYLYRELYLETQETGHITIGDEVVISRGVHLVAHYGIKIGQGSMIGEYCSIRDANHCFGKNIAPRYSGHQGSEIRIGSHVWIGRGVCILPGVSIGDGAVIGANAVVTHDVEPYRVVAGVPAREISK